MPWMQNCSLSLPQHDVPCDPRIAQQCGMHRPDRFVRRAPVLGGIGRAPAGREGDRGQGRQEGEDSSARAPSDDHATDGSHSRRWRVLGLWITPGGSGACTYAGDAGERIDRAAVDAVGILDRVALPCPVLEAADQLAHGVAEFRKR